MHRRRPPASPASALQRKKPRLDPGHRRSNYAFVDRFQAVARGHFTARRLERKYDKDKDIVFAAYE
jgi:hypothetical protein